MENNEEINEQELSEVIEYLIEVGAMEIMGYDSVSDNFTYKVTSKCKEIYPELYYAHYEAVGELAQSLWMQDIIDIVFTEGETIVGVTPEQIDFIKETINTFTDDERFFLETILNHYDQR
jgi:phosphoserine aminotransferase